MPRLPSRLTFANRPVRTRQSSWRPNMMSSLNGARVFGAQWWQMTKVSFFQELRHLLLVPAAVSATNLINQILVSISQHRSFSWHKYDFSHFQSINFKFQSANHLVVSVLQEVHAIVCHHLQHLPTGDLCQGGHRHGLKGHVTFKIQVP